MSVSIITPTGGRPEALMLLAKMLARQSYRHSMQWIVVDDVDPASPVPDFADVIRPEPRWSPGENTQARNLLAGLGRAVHDRVLVMEDDDWYAPTYVEAIATHLDHASLVGEGRARYYHVGRRCWRRHQNRTHASLCQTAFRGDYVERLAGICRTTASGVFLDIELWRSGGGTVLPSELAVGMKGLPGRPGIGTGHQAKPPAYTPDPGLEVLRGWIGADAEWYAGYGERQGGGSAAA